jgi:hypothetical protein
MMRLIMLVFLFSLLPHPRTLAASPSEEKLRLHCGAVIEDVFNIDYKNSSIEVVFWLWVRSESEPYPVIEYIDIKGAHELRISELFVDTLQHNNKTVYLTQAQFHAKILTAFDDSRYPLDNQEVKIIIEFIQEFAEDLDVITYPEDLQIQPDFVQNWEIHNEKAQIIQTHSNSTFGFYSEKAHSYKALQIEYQLKKNHSSLFIKSFFVVFVSFFLAAISFFLPNSKSEEKISLIIGALFTAIGNMYIVSNATGAKPQLGLVDHVHMITFSFLLFFAVMAIIEQRGNWKNNLRFDVLMFLSATFAYAAAIFIACTS